MYDDDQYYIKSKMFLSVQFFSSSSLTIKYYWRNNFLTGI